ncbi:hypothetical protein ACX9NE_20890 [Mycobacterium sp. ML4]
MKLSKIAATAAMTGALGSAALGIGAGFAQADPSGPGGPGPNVPGPNIPGPNVPGQQPGPGYVPGTPICNGGPGVNCNGPGSPLPPGQNGFPPPGHYNDPVRYGLPAVWSPELNGPQYPVVFNPAVNQWGVFVNGQFVAYAGT